MRAKPGREIRPGQEIVPINDDEVGKSTKTVGRPQKKEVLIYRKPKKKTWPVVSAA